MKASMRPISVSQNRFTAAREKRKHKKLKFQNYLWRLS
ncbi:hypothetical protein MAMP_01151 [Methylophaga aminisulfidivorans MP]|uniref:Uncharacterized protein n=1 Tax=Methylophaga aminisulfidivorans MP TaxID=1026882 RepID=F5SZR1_9GAMM|nr:hypothetical protein MAMP_01151 [Methylophaga aminisulfidivorans MP]